MNMSTAGEDFVTLKYRELLEKIENARIQLATFTSELKSIEDAVKRIEDLPEDAVLYEKAGHVFIRRNKEEVLLDLKAQREALTALIEQLKDQRRKAEMELRQLVESVRSGSQAT